MKKKIFFLNSIITRTIHQKWETITASGALTTERCILAQEDLKSLDPSAEELPESLILDENDQPIYPFLVDGTLSKQYNPTKKTDRIRV